MWWNDVVLGIISWQSHLLFVSMRREKMSSAPLHLVITNALEGCFLVGVEQWL